jgi:predicted hydrocarbon binding protein
MSERRFAFNWELIGDIDVGRPNLGPTTRLEIYRLMQFTLRDVLEQHYGTEQANRLFYEAGRLAGVELYGRLFSHVTEFNDFVSKLQSALKDFGVAVLRVEQADLANGVFVLTMSEDLDCSGLPELEHEICAYDEGFLAGLLESFTGAPFTVKEIDCWCTGDRTCRFRAESRHE